MELSSEPKLNRIPNNASCRCQRQFPPHTLLATPSNHATLVTHELAFKPLRHRRIRPTTPLRFRTPAQEIYRA